MASEKRFLLNFEKKGRLLYDDLAIKKALTAFASKGYENEVATVAAKILLRT